MQKSMKRLLSVLAVLALVLTMAPAGILAVETKAEGTEPEHDYSATNWDAVPETALTKAQVEAEQKKQTDALALLDEMDAAGLTEAADRAAYLNGKKCPLCGENVETWTLVAATNAAVGENGKMHYFASGIVTGTAAGNIIQVGKNASACLLLDKNAEINTAGRICLSTNGSAMKIGGAGTIANTKADYAHPLLSVVYMGTLDLYGGKFTAVNNAALTKAIIYSAYGSSKVNIWTNDVEIGPAAAATSAGYNINVNTNDVFNMYAGTIQNGRAASDQGYQSGNVYLTKGTFNMFGGTIKKGYSTRGANMVVASAATAANIYGGIIEEGYATSNGGGIYSAGNNLNIYGGIIQKNKSVYPGGGLWIAGNKTISGAKITENESTSSHGGNLFINGGTTTLEATTVISKGKTGASGSGGNIYVNNSTKLTIKCDLTDGHAYNAGNLYVDGAATEVTLDGATLSGGTIRLDSDIQYNGRVNGGKLILKNGATCAGGILFLDAATSVLHVDTSFSGDFALWQNGAAYALGAPVRYFTCNGAFTGIVKNSNHLLADAASGQEKVWLTFAMEWDGQTGLKVPAQGVVYDHVLTPAASNQAAVDAFTAAMADEEVEKKPQYVMINGDVNIGANEVAIDALADITVSGTGTVYGVDRANDNYAATAGSITADGVTVAKEVTADGRRYIALSDATVDANKYTFHRVETKLTNVTVNVANAGIYYKAEYQFDEIVKDRIASYGVNVNLEGSTKEGQTSSSDMSIYDAESHTLTAKSHGVYGIFKDTNLASTNKENGQIKLCGNPYLAIDTTGNMESSDCPEFTAAESTKMSLADAMEMANEKWEAINEEGKPMLKEFFAKWMEAGAWDAEWAAKLTNLILAEA